MSIKNFLDSSNKLTSMIETLEKKSLENINTLEDILKDTSRTDNFLLEKQINTCFELQCKIEDLYTKLMGLELMDYSVESPNVVIDFISNTPNVENDLGPESLVVVPSEEVGLEYIQLLQGLVKNVIIVTMRAMTAGEVNKPLGNVKTALLDGSEAEYQKFLGSEAVRLIIADHVPADRLFRVCGDVHRHQCFAMIRANGEGGDDVADDDNKSITWQ